MQSVRQATQGLKRQLDALPGWLGLMLAAAALTGLSLVVWQFQTSRPSVRSGAFLLDGRSFSDSQLGLIVQAFAKSKLSGYVLEGHRVRIPQGQEPVYLAALAEGDALPRDFQSHTTAALQQSKIFETERERRQRMRHAREQDLAQAIRAMDGVDEAMVQFDEIEQRGFQRQRIVTASVAIMPTAESVLDRGQIRAIRHLVAGANAGMTVSDVSITDLRSGVSYVGGSEDHAALPVAVEYLRVKRAIEREWQQKITQVLSFVPHVQVAVDVELALDDSSGHDQLSVLTDPRRLAVSVAVPDSHLIDVWLQRRSGGGGRVPAPEELQSLKLQTQDQIRDAIVGLVPDHIDMASAVTVTTFQDPTRAGQFAWGRGLKWTDALARHRVAWIGVVLVGLIVGLFTRFWRRQSATNGHAGTIPIHAYQPNSSPAVALEHEQDVAQEIDEGALRATLTNLVREDPDGAAEILHRWIEKAG